MNLNNTLGLKTAKIGARFISYIFTPFSVPFLSLAVILLFTHLTFTLSRYDIFLVLDIVFRFTIVLPLISIFFLHKINHLSFNSKISVYDKLIGAFMVSTLCYLFIYIVVSELGQSPLHANFISITSVLLLFFLIPYKWRKEAKVKGIIDEYDAMPLDTLNRRKQRYMPLILTLISYIFCAMMMFKKALPWYLNAIIITSILILIIHLCINIKWRVSEHMAAIGAVTGGIIALSNVFSYNPLAAICVSTIIAGLLGSARMILQRHTVGEVLIGYFVGLSCSLIALNNTFYHYISTIFTYKLL